MFLLEFLFAVRHTEKGRNLGEPRKASTEAKVDLT